MKVFDLPNHQKEHLYKLLTQVSGLSAVLPEVENLKVEEVFLRLVTHKNSVSLINILKNKISNDGLLCHYELDQSKYSLHYLDFKQEEIVRLNGVEKQWVIILYPRLERGK